MTEPRKRSKWIVFVAVGCASFAGTLAALTLSPPQSGYGRRAEKTLAPRETKHDEVRPQIGGLHGRVFDEAGPVAGARVCLSPRVFMPASVDGVHCASTAEDGRYVLKNVPLGRYSASALAKGYAIQAHDGGVPFTLANRLEEELDFHLSHGGARLSGVVVDGTGGVLPHALVQIAQVEANERVVSQFETDEEGGFEAMVGSSSP